MSDSVGKISLDLEVNSDLQGQISKVSSNIANGLKNNLQNMSKGLFNGVENKIKGSTDKIEKTLSSSMNRVSDKIKNTFKSIKDIRIPAPKIEPSKSNVNIPKAADIKSDAKTRGPPSVDLSKLTAEISNTEKTLDNINARIEQQQEKLALLKDSYNNTFNTSRKNKVQEQMLKTEATINKLIDQSDKLGFKLSDLDSKLAAAKSMQGKFSESTGNATNKIRNLTDTSSKSNGILSRLGNSFRGIGGAGKTANNGFVSANSGLSMFMGTMLKWGIIFPMIQRGIASLGSFLASAFMSNEEFANSLNLIKSNLYTAFAPIYQAVLPALNALMSALATATAYIASFINNLFGSTYSAGFSAAKNLQNSIGAYEMQGKAAKKAATSLTGAGKAAKKAGKDAKNALASFDEINQLNNSKNGSGSGSPGSGVVDPITPMPNMGPIEEATQKWAEKFKRLLEPIWKAWQNEGENTINSLKYALSSIGELSKSIARSFEEVWINGTGQETCELILQILQDVFNIIGDIAVAFNNAWKEDNRGTKIIQNLWSSFNNLLYIIKEVGLAFREVLQKIGASVATHLMKVLESLSGVILHLTSKLREIWDDGGKYCFEQIIEFAGRTINILCDIINNSLAPMANFIIDTLGPVINFILNVIGLIFEKLNQFLEWLDGDGNGILTAVVDTLLSFGAAWLVVKAGIAIFDGLQTVMGLVMSATTLLSGAIAFLTSPLGLVTIAIGAVILIGYELYKHWDELKVKAQQTWDSIKNKFDEFKNWLDSVFATDWSQKFGLFGDILNGFLQNVRNIFGGVKQVFQGLIDFVCGVFTGNWSRAWNGCKEIFRGVFQSLAGIAKAPMNAVISVINAAISGINSISVDIPEGIPGIGGKHFGPHISKIPYLARGGIVDQPTLAMVGEAGKEAVMPLENNTGWISNLAGQIASQLPQGGSVGSKQSLQINIYQDGVLTTTKVIDDINEMTQANGGVCPINI